MVEPPKPFNLKILWRSQRAGMVVKKRSTRRKTPTRKKSHTRKKTTKTKKPYKKTSTRKFKMSSKITFGLMMYIALLAVALCRAQHGMFERMVDVETLC